jgi:hypothetical protein
VNEVVQIVLYKLNSLYGEDVIIRLFLNFNGIIPYNDSGAIEFGGDYEPLNLLMVTYGPLVPAPLDAIVVVPVYATYVSHTTTSTIVNSSVLSPIGSYSRITATFFDQYISNPFDDSFIVQVNDPRSLLETHWNWRTLQ